VGADGGAYVSDTANIEVDRLVPGGFELEMWAGSGAFGPKGGVLDGISVLGNRLFVNTLATSKLICCLDRTGRQGRLRLRGTVGSSH
jgi:hypothetical protein